MPRVISSLTRRRRTWLRRRRLRKKRQQKLQLLKAEGKEKTVTFRQLMGELPALCEEFSYLGSYSEVV